MRPRLILAVILAGGCSKSPSTQTAATVDGGAREAADVAMVASLPLVLVADVPLPGKAVRFDYQDFDVAKGNLIIAHMNDASVVIVRASDGSVVKEIGGIPTPRGVVVADDVGRIFITSSPNKLVILDNTTFTELGRVDTGSAPDGVGWDPTHKIVGVSDQGDGAASLITESGSGTRKQVPLGGATGNIAFDATHGVFWITVEKSPNQLIAIDPVAARATTTISLPGCSGAHGLRIHPDGRSAFVACEGNSKIVRVDLVTDAHPVDIAPSGQGPDVLAIDSGLGWLYVAAESGDLTVFDIRKPGLVTINTAHPGDASHTVAVDPTTHHVFFPLLKGPVLRIMKPAGT